MHREPLQVAVETCLARWPQMVICDIGGVVVVRGMRLTHLHPLERVRAPVLRWSGGPGREEVGRLLELAGCGEIMLRRGLRALECVSVLGAWAGPGELQELREIASQLREAAAVLHSPEHTRLGVAAYLAAEDAVCSGEDRMQEVVSRLCAQRLSPESGEAALADTLPRDAVAAAEVALGFAGYVQSPRGLWQTARVLRAVLDELEVAKGCLAGAGVPAGGQGEQARERGGAADAISRCGAPRRSQYAPR